MSEVPHRGILRIRRRAQKATATQPGRTQERSCGGMAEFDGNRKVALDGQLFRCAVSLVGIEVKYCLPTAVQLEVNTYKLAWLPDTHPML